jgi:Arc/MetJ family transcription regulator
MLSIVETYAATSGRTAARRLFCIEGLPDARTAVRLALAAAAGWRLGAILAGVARVVFTARLRL